MTSILQYQKFCELGTGRTDITYLTEVSSIIGLDCSKLTQDEVLIKTKEWISSIVASKKDFKYVKLKGKWYKVDKDLVNLKFSQWIQFDNVMINMNKDNIYKDLHFIIGVFIRPCRFWKLFPKKFNGADFISTSKLVQENMDITIGINLFGFFLTYTESFMKNTTIDYLGQLEAQAWEVPSE